MHKSVLDIATFLQHVERDMDRPPGTLQREMHFRDLPDWTSLQALLVVAGFQRDYGVTMTSDAFDRAETLDDLYRCVIEGPGD